MHKILIVGALAAVALTHAQPSEAYDRGRWCAKMDIGTGAVGERCDFQTFAACNRHVNSMPRSFCVQNSWNAANWGIDEEFYSSRGNRRYR
jgi:hypothetical protein